MGLSSYRSATFAEYALGHVSRLVGGQFVADVDETKVLGYQESGLREHSSHCTKCRTINLSSAKYCARRRVKLPPKDEK